jgi:hypothetical protein
VVALAFAALDWRTVPMPGADAPVELARLPTLADGAFRAFVRFPPGWARLQIGHYAAAEEFLVLEGELALDEQHWGAGGYAWITADRVRSAVRSASGCLVFAWFSSPPRWITGRPSRSPTQTDLAFGHWREAPQRELGHRLHADGHETWIVARRQLEALAAPRIETLALQTRAWSWCAPREAAATGNPDEPMLVRAFAR